MSPQNLETAKKTVKEFFEKTTFEADVESIKEKEGTFFISLKTEDPQILIGEGGEVLNEIQHLLKAILRKKIEDLLYLDIDINGYKKKKLEYLKELAFSTADEVSLTKKEKELPPMSAYERRVVHMELVGREDVVTQSIGEEPDRRIVVSPRPLS